MEIGSVVTTVTAVDPDINPTITYSFAPGGNQDRMFNIDAYSGTITLAEPLDRERQQSYNLVVTASDSQHSDQSYISVNIQDENDNAPVFTEQSYQVREFYSLAIYLKKIEEVSSHRILYHKYVWNW